MRYDKQFADDVLQAMEAETKIVVGVGDIVRRLFPEEFYKSALFNADGPEYQKVLGHVLVLLERGLVANASEETMSVYPFEIYDFNITLEGHYYLESLRDSKVIDVLRDNTAERFKD